MPQFSDKKTSHINDKYFEVAPRDSASLIGEEGNAEMVNDLYKRSPEQTKMRKDSMPSSAKKVEFEDLFKPEEIGATDASQVRDELEQQSDDEDELIKHLME